MTPSSAGDVEARDRLAEPRTEQVGCALGQPDGVAGGDRGIRRAESLHCRVVLGQVLFVPCHGVTLAIDDLNVSNTYSFVDACTPTALSSGDDLAALLYDVSYLTGSVSPFGQTATEYFDKYQFESRPELLRRFAVALAALVPADIEVLAGLEMGGIPVAAALSLETGLPAVFVRKRARVTAPARWPRGSRWLVDDFLVIEDVLTSGGQVVLSTRDLRDAGAVVSQALCVIKNRRSPDARALAAADIDLRALFTENELRAAVF